MSRAACLGIVTDAVHHAVDLARAPVLAMLEDRAGPFADAGPWAAWRWTQSGRRRACIGGLRRRWAEAAALPAVRAGQAGEGPGAGTCVQGVAGAGVFAVRPE